MFQKIEQMVDYVVLEIDRVGDFDPVLSRKNDSVGGALVDIAT